MKIVFATHNKGKILEWQEILACYNFELLSALDINSPDVIEDQSTFIGNASKKAREVAEFSQLPTIADDSGLEIEVLEGEPGIYSARYAKTNDERIQKVLAKLSGKSNRRANFTCALAFALPNGWIQAVEGKIFGNISHEIKGEGGFGYDPIFIPDGYTESFAQMNNSEKNSISHRSEALKIAREKKAFDDFINMARQA